MAIARSGYEKSINPTTSIAHNMSYEQRMEAALALLDIQKRPNYSATAKNSISEGLRCRDGSKAKPARKQRRILNVDNC